MAAPIGKNATPITVDSHRVAVSIDISDLVGRVEREALRLLKLYTNQGFSGDELVRLVTSGIEELSDAPIEKSARGAVSEAFSLGKNEAAQQVPERIGKVVRTELLDLNTCEPCRKLDGTIYDFNSDAYFENMPPAKCDGRELCRGFYIYLDEAAA